MINSHRDFVWVRGLRYHVRRWGDPARPMMILLHGWMDVSATFQHLVEELLPHWQVVAPDWRGLGYSDWAPDGYWFADYLADLDVLFERYADGPVVLAGHSMGAQAASLYAGLRPDRVSQLVIMDGLFLPDMESALAPKRMTTWLDQLRDPPKQRFYDSIEDLAARVRKQHPQIDDERATFIARCWSHRDSRGRLTLCADPAHRFRGPMLYRAAESEAIWRGITAPTVFIDGSVSAFVQAIDAETKAHRRACFKTRSEHVIDGAGHMLHFDAPAATGRLMAKLLGPPA